MLLYIHGFNSSSLSSKAQETRRWLATQGRESEWVCPNLHHQPAQAIQQLSDIIESATTPPKLIGSSLGGFYATVLVARYALRAVVVNPAVHPALVLAQALNTEQRLWHDDTTYRFTQQHLDELTALDSSVLLYPEHILMLQEKGDEVLDWTQAVHYYRDCHQLIFNGGDHGFRRYRMVLSLIDDFLNSPTT